MPVEVAKRKISSWEFVQWAEFLRRELGRADLLVMQVAAVQAEIRDFRNVLNAWFGGKEPEASNVNDFVVKLVYKNLDSDDDEFTVTPPQDSKPVKGYDIGWRDRVDPRTLPPEQQEAYKKRVSEEDKAALAGALFMVPGFMEQLAQTMPAPEQDHGGHRPDAGT